MINVKFVENEQIYKILADPNRRRILAMLCQEALSVAEIANRLKLSPQAVRYHLSHLEETDLVNAVSKRRCQNAYHVLEKVYKATADRFHFNFGTQPKSHPILSNCLDKVTEVLRKIGLPLSSFDEVLIDEMLFEVNEKLDSMITNIQKLLFEKNGHKIDRSILANILVKQIFLNQVP